MAKANSQNGGRREQRMAPGPLSRLTEVPLSDRRRCFLLEARSAQLQGLRTLPQDGCIVRLQGEGDVPDCKDRRKIAGDDRAEGR